MKNPKVSIVVPIYNVEKYLQRCINSLVNQTLSDIEIILVDDGSTDGSREIMENAAHRDSRIKCYTKENGGLSDARNYGIRQATGEFLGFVDSDDWVEATMFEIMYNRAKENCDIVICNIHKVNENGDVFRTLPQMTKNQKEIIDLRNDFSGFGDLSWFACNKIFKKEIFSGIEFPVGLHYEDIATIPRLFLRCQKIGFCEEYFYNYFEREGSITRNFTQKGLDMFVAISLVEKALKKSSYADMAKEWKRFIILNGFYSYLAYVAYVKDKPLKREMYEKLDEFMKKHKIKPLEIIRYNRFGQNYLTSLPLYKSLYYLSFLIFKKNNFI